RGACSYGAGHARRPEEDLSEAADDVSFAPSLDRGGYFHVAARNRCSSPSLPPSVARTSTSCPPHASSTATQPPATPCQTLRSNPTQPLKRACADPETARTTSMRPV